MDSRRRHLLKKHGNDIVRDLNVEDIIDELIAAETLTDDDYYTIKLENHPREKTKKLIEIILRGDNNAYDVFVNSLKKYYDWLWKPLQITEDNVDNNIVYENIEDKLSRGEVPKLPLHYVPRSGLEERLKQYLIDLKRHDVLLLHGMPGSGKTSLIVSTLRNNLSLVAEHFSGNIIWTNVGDCNTEERIMQLQMRVLKRISCDDKQLNTSSSIMSLGSITGSFYEPDFEDHRDRMKINFEEQNLRECLLIIDDLKNKKVLDAFNIGCKILITTQDSKLAEEYNPDIFNVPGCLTEQESLELIAKCVNQSFQKLPSQAKDMHNLCKGSPLLMSMLGGMLAENKESLKHDKKRWNHFVKQLKNRSGFIDRFNSTKSTKDTFLAVEMCIKSLNCDKYIKMYKSLVVLPDNAKISVRALSVILDIQESNIEDLVKLLKTKSLIIEHYHIDHKMYQYEIHDFIILYLKYIHKESELRELHANLLENYLKICTGKNLINIPDDGYIAHHIAYHIYESHNTRNMWNLFPSLYTNLEFIGNKIRIAGVSSIHDDFQYLDRVKIEDEHKERMDNFIDCLGKFISHHGHDLHRYPHTDIIQSIFQYEHEGILYDEALKISTMEHNRNRLYFRFNNDLGAEKNYMTVHVDTQLCVVRFWLNYIFVGNKSGTISLWNISSYKKLLTFYQHDDVITSIAISFIPPFKMASTSLDGVLKIWKINHLNHNSDDSADSEADDNFINFYDISESISVTHQSGKLCDVNWSRKSNILLTHTNPGAFIILYNSSGKIIKSINMGEDYQITCSTFSVDDTLIIIGCNSNANVKHAVHIYCSKTFNLLMTFYEYSEVKKLLPILNDPKSILVLSSTYIQIHKWNNVSLSSSSQAIENISHTKIDNENFRHHNFQTAAVGGDTYLFIATTQCHILVYDLVKCQYMGILNNHRGKVITMDVMEYKDETYGIYSNILITASGNDDLSFKLWCIDSTQFSSNIIKKTVFDCAFTNKSLSYETSNKIAHIREKSEPSVRRSETVNTGENNNKIYLKKTLSLDKKSLKLMNLENFNPENFVSPLIGVADSSDSIQIIRGKSLIGRTNKACCTVTCISLSRCGLYLAYGLKNGDVINMSLKTMCGSRTMQIRESVEYLEYITSSLLVAAGKDNCLMIYEIIDLDNNKANVKMVINSCYDLGSQELLDSITGKRKTPELNGNDNNVSPTSTSSCSSVFDIPDSFKRSNRFNERTLYRFSPTIKCYLIKDKELLTVSQDGSIKLFNLEPKLLEVLVKNQAMSISSVCLRNDNLVLCDRNGTFQIYHLHINEVSLKLRSVLKHSINEKIVCCDISYDNKILAMGCSSGHILLWHTVDRTWINTIKFHKIAVQCLEFSPIPFGIVKNNDLKHNSNNEIDKCEDDTAPLVLVSISGQIVWWDISYILRKKKENFAKRSMGSSRNILSPIVKPIFSAVTPTETTSTFIFPENPLWEKLWRGKKSKKDSKRKDILSCIKLTGDKGIKIKTNERFSTFVTVDQGGVLSIMSVFQNNKKY